MAAARSVACPATADGKSAATQGGGSGQQKKRSVPAVDDKRMRALAAAMVRESERETLQGIRLELEQVCRAHSAILAHHSGVNCTWHTVSC